MDYDIVIFWFVLFSSLFGLAVLLARVRSVGSGWIVLYVGILVVCLAGWFWKQKVLIFLAAAMWLLLVLLPGLIGQLYHRRFVQHQYASARRLARIISYLHPADGWRQQPEIVRAHELAQRGEVAEATALLRRFQGSKSSVGIAAVTSLYRLTNQWEELLAWHAQHPREIARHPQLLSGLLRACGETGDLSALVEVYATHGQQIGKLIPASTRDLCRLMLFAFCGKQEHTKRLFATSLAFLPAAVQEFWLATADQASGERESAQQRLEALLPAANPPLRSAIQRRLSRISIASEPLSAATQSLIEHAAQEHSQDESFGARRSLFSKHARGTQILIVLNILMFAAEIYFGGGTNMDVLYRLGGMLPAAVRAGEWWRLVASLFLHFGALHLAMNMLALWLLGPFTEFALGLRKFFFVYLLAGIGSMGVVMTFASGPNRAQLTVGASGCVMGLVGATGALMLRGWLREKALSARRRLVAMLVIVAMQTVFDSVVPQVSMTAHLSGTLIGFAAVMILRDRLSPSASARLNTGSAATKAIPID